MYIVYSTYLPTAYTQQVQAKQVIDLLLIVGVRSSSHFPHISPVSVSLGFFSFLPFLFFSPLSCCSSVPPRVSTHRYNGNWCELSVKARRRCCCCCYCHLFAVATSWLSLETLETLANKLSPRVQPFLRGANKKFVVQHRLWVWIPGPEWQNTPAYLASVRIRSRLASPHTSRNGAPFLHFTNTSPHQSHLVHWITKLLFLNHLSTSSIWRQRCATTVRYQTWRISGLRAIDSNLWNSISTSEPSTRPLLIYAAPLCTHKAHAPLRQDYV
ncbi:hypothetical protein F5B22DRAFT_259172 [Xylaria bambusicola]|uniref:uncharacterized protein n=1 Tax=Xylaria bambusicola TaxID=326684 RepID=UPI00200721D6|nr:uncharacterized protein F5B22DRAFT_259172 [Xylaria bambusicola]KAI0525912.1 hypothetical protein F5B22DRAFT_259172 [Xylaria bambusicola]